MWTRIGLKANAKKLLMKNYWRIVLVAFILALVSGGVSATINAQLNDYSSSVVEKSMENMKMPSGDISDGTMAAQIFRKNFFDTYNQINQEMYNVMKNIDWFKIQMIMLLGLLMAVAYIVFSAFIFAPIEIGCRRWFLMNRTGKPEIKEIVRNMEKKSNIRPPTKRVRSSRNKRMTLLRNVSFAEVLEISFFEIFFSFFFVAIFQRVKSSYKNNNFQQMACGFIEEY